MPKRKQSKLVDRRDYQRRYYLAHIEKAREYQRLYAKKHRKSTTRRRNKNAIVFVRPAIKRSYSPGDLQHLSVEALARVGNGILSGRLTLAGI